MTDAETVARVDIRRTIREHIRTTDARTRGETATHVVAVHGVTWSTATDELDALERAGFLYRVGDGASAEVKLP